MKFALWLLVCCILVIAGTVVFAPEYAHKIIDRFHGHVEHLPKPQQNEINNESDSRAGTDKTTITTTPITITSIKNRHDVGNSKVVPMKGVVVKSVEKLNSKKELLEWLKEDGYSVIPEQGNYRISCRMFNRTDSKPSGLISRNGKVAPYYGGVAIGIGNRISNINSNNINQQLTISEGPITLTNNGITITHSINYQNGWGVETKRSFLWIPSRDNIEAVWSKTKKIKCE